VKVWEFRRELRCWLLENALDGELIVDLTIIAAARRVRHKRPGDGACEQLRQQIVSTNRWSDE
jgi:hypothetical protein